MHFMLAEYSATGEGMTIAILITRIQPRERDWKRRPSFAALHGYVPGELATPVEKILARQFVESFGSFIARGPCHLEKERFLAVTERHLPPAVREVLDGAIPPGFHYSSELHVNYS